jgi:tetratricopeptide (TPR) repeat protein
MTKRALPKAVRLAGLALAMPVCVAAAGPVLAQGLVQAVPAPAPGQALNAALGRLARDPRDLAALIDAGNAALQMGDIDAAIGFFARADQISPNNMRVKAGLAGALVRSENPYDAIPLFAEAERAGAVDPALAVDRGLAYDLVGDNATAQKYYRQALAAAPNDEALRRLAVSLAIAGDRKGMEGILSPLLQRQDKGAWRARAFALAILGAPEEGVAIANQVMPADLANGIAPYLRYMPRLTAAQQAAAANLGRFPRAADIGRDDPRVALYAPPRRVAPAVGAGLVPTGEPLGRSRSRSAQRVAVATPAEPARAAPPEIAPTRSDAPPPIALPAARPSPPPAPSIQPPAVTVAVRAQLAPVIASVAPAAAPRPAVAAAEPVATPPRPSAAPQPASRPAPVPAVASSSASFDLGRVGTAAARPATPPSATPAPATLAPAAPPSVAPKPRPRLADAFSDLAALPKAPSAPPPGAVDVRRLAEARAKAEAAKVPPKPAHPSRIWVQVGTGRELGALGFTWRGLAKDNPALFKGQSPSVSDWGRTNRLLAGPFATEAAAEAFLAKARKADLDAFLWTSPAGQVVDALPSR